MVIIGNFMGYVKYGSIAVDAVKYKFCVIIMASPEFRSLLLEYGPGPIGERAVQVLERITGSEGASGVDDWNMVVGLSYWFDPGLRLEETVPAVSHQLSTACASEDLPYGIMRQSLMRWFTQTVRIERNRPGSVAGRLVDFYNRTHEDDRSVDEVKAEIWLMIEGGVTPLETRISPDGRRVLVEERMEEITG